MKSIKFILIGCCLIFSSISWAHDEGHGPKLADTGNYGGLVTAVVDNKGAGLGAKAPLIYKAELSRSEDRTVRVYLYDKSMKTLGLEAFDKSAQAVLIANKKGKEVTLPFELKLEGKVFIGKAPEAPAKPYNIDIRYKLKDKTLLSAFDNLD